MNDAHDSNGPRGLEPATGGALRWGASQFRQVPIEASGRLLLHSMPGRDEPLDTALSWMSLEGVTRVVCLLSDREIAERNPEYLSAIVRQDARLPRVERFPVPDPAEAAGSAALAGQLAAALRAGEVVLIHCALGQVRTPALARIVLEALGYTPDEAAQRVSRAVPRG
ncbi:MAG TPA: hypothetical protein PLU22_03325 [Polyangiaceae bacterium]|nr:hypothetical protein [Polyangiaceae bacterium]